MKLDLSFLSEAQFLILTNLAARVNTIIAGTLNMLFMIVVGELFGTIFACKFHLAIIAHKYLVEFLI